MFTFIALMLGALLVALALPLVFVIVLMTLAGGRRRAGQLPPAPDAYPFGAPRPAGWIDGQYYPYGVFDPSASHQQFPYQHGHHHGAPTHHTGHTGHMGHMGHMGGAGGMGHMGGGIHAGGHMGGGGAHGGH